MDDRSSRSESIGSSCGTRHGRDWARLDLSPIVIIGVVASVVLASLAGAMFPMANVVAVERFGDLGGLLGVFRAAQMIVAWVSAWIIGFAAEAFGLIPALVAGTLALTVVLFVVARRRRRNWSSVRVASGRLGAGASRSWIMYTMIEIATDTTLRRVQ